MKDSLTRTDYWAQDRTHLANERTLLAYLRTSLSFLILGAFLIKFFPSPLALALAFLAIFFGSVTLFIYGVVRFRRYKKTIDGR